MKYFPFITFPAYKKDISTEKWRRGGYSVIELVFVMALLVVFGVTTYLLIAVGGNTYERVMENRDQNSNLRVVLSYITTRVRQNDIQGSISVVDTDTGSMLVVSETLEDGEMYETRIYCYNGILYEDLVEAGAPYEANCSFELTAAGSLDLDYSAEPELDCGILRVTVYAPEEDGGSLSTVLKIRSGAAEVSS